MRRVGIIRGSVLGLHNYQEFSQPSECLYEAIIVNTEKVLYCFYKIIFKIRANLKRHNLVYILSPKGDWVELSLEVDMYF